MEHKKYAWIYCRIDASEDLHETLKLQYQQLYNYAEQMDFEVIGSSSDTGIGIGLEWPGLQKAIQAAKENQTQALLIYQTCSGLTADVFRLLLYSLASEGIEIYSSLAGKLDLLKLENSSKEKP